MEKKSKLLCVTVVARHGARSPNWAELSPFKGSKDSAVVAQWGLQGNSFDTDAEKKKADNNLSEIGREQMRQLGKSLRDYYPEYVLSESVEWHSSTAGRCEESGKLFWQGTGREVLPDIKNDYNRDEAFKAWDIKNTEYKSYIDSLKNGENSEFNAQAKDHKERLKVIWAKVGVDTDSIADSLMYYWSCYGHCLLECEHYFFGAKRGVMTEALLSEERSLLSDLACAVWERRFHSSGHARFIGGNLLQLVTTLKPDTKFRFMSCHDYSILSLLAAAGETRYHEHLAFGAYLVIEHYDNGIDYFFLSPRPFAHNTDQLLSSSSVRLPLYHSFIDSIKIFYSIDSLKQKFENYDLPAEQVAFLFKDIERALGALATRVPSARQALGLRHFADAISTFIPSQSKTFSFDTTLDPTLIFTSFILRYAAFESCSGAIAVLSAYFWLFSYLFEPSNSSCSGTLYSSRAFQNLATTYSSFFETTVRLADDDERALLLSDFQRSMHFLCAFIDKISFPKAIKKEESSFSESLLRGLS